MTPHPDKPKFSFSANNTTPEDTSGLAEWEYSKPSLTGGGWLTDFIVLPFDSFREAQNMDAALKAIWTGGEAAGYATAETGVLNALMGRRP